MGRHTARAAGFGSSPLADPPNEDPVRQPELRTLVNADPWTVRHLGRRTVDKTRPNIADERMPQTWLSRPLRTSTGIGGLTQGADVPAVARPHPTLPR